VKWYKITVNDAAVADGALNRISDAFERIMPPGDESKGCALFVRNEVDASAVFVSPEFAAIASQPLKTFSAVECEPPPPRRKGEEFGGTSLLLASHSKSAWALLH
jgi:hypothetical protein